MIARNGFEDIAGIVFDAVGTLIEPVPHVAEVYARAAARQGVDLPASLMKARFRQHFGEDEVDERRGPLATDEATERRRWRRIVAGCLPEVPDPDRAFAELWDHFADPASWAVFADVSPALDRLRALGLRLAIGSNFDGRLHRVVEGLEPLSGWSDPLVISSEVGYRKPHAAFYEAACRRLELPPGRVLCVGDDPENDVRGPNRAGMRAALVDRDGSAPPDLPRLAGLGDLL